MKRQSLSLLAVFLACMASSTARAERYQWTSPNGDISIEVQVAQAVSWSVSYKGGPVLESSQMGMIVDGKLLPGDSPKLIDAKSTTIEEIVRPTVATRAAVLNHHARALTLVFEGGVSLEFLACDTGVAYRFVTQREGEGEVAVQREVAHFSLAQPCKAYFPEETGFVSHYEREYKELNLSDITKDQFCSLPVLLESESHVFVAITDADLYDYPAMFLAGTSGNALSAVFPHAVLKAEPDSKGPDRNERITEEAEYIAKTRGNRSFPWRVVMIADQPGKLIEDDLVFKLSRPLALEEAGWIKPGKVAWDWWNALNLYGVDFAAGINTTTYKYYIDFASQYGLEYIILDEGWSKTTTNLLETKPDVDVAQLVKYGQEKNVGVILWTLWKPLDENMEAVLDTWAGWGIKGIKVDFMQRADQQMVNFYERTAREAAKRKLLVDFHGAFKPAGLRRAWPNVVNYEGLKGLENSKWSDLVTPKHDVTLPFTRMLAGPMDYTPGAMDNSQKENFAARFTRPMSQGTRCHQVAMYVVYESPLQMLADSPSQYLREPECTKFIAQIPTTWDESRVLAGEVGKYIIVARRQAASWYLAAMTDWEPRTLTVDLAFLGEGNWSLDYVTDGINAAHYASDYKMGTREATGKDVLEIKLAPGGGWAGVFKSK